MAWPTFEAVLRAVDALRPPVVDVTGGAPELNPNFRRFVTEVRARGVSEVIDRCNLTVLLLPSQAGLAEFLAEQRVHVVASLPAANAGQTDAQRGSGVFERSLEGLRRLNAVGYAKPGTGLELTRIAMPAPDGSTAHDQRVLPLGFVGVGGELLLGARTAFGASLRAHVMGHFDHADDWGAHDHASALATGGSELTVSPEIAAQGQFYVSYRL